MACATALRTPAWVVCLLVWRGTGCWKVEFGEWTQGGASYWLWGDSLKGREWELHNWERLWRKPGPPQKQGAIVEWRIRGGTTIATPFPTHWPLLPWALGWEPIWAGSPPPSSQGLLWLHRHQQSCAPPLPGPPGGSTNAGGGWVIKCGTRRADPGRGLLLGMWRWPEGTGVRSSTDGILLEAWSASETRCHCGVAHRGQGCHHRLSPHMPAPASVGTERDSYQSKRAPVCCKLLTASATMGTIGGSHQSEHVWPSHESLVPPLPEWACVPESVAAACLSHLSEQAWHSQPCLHPLSPGNQATAEYLKGQWVIPQLRLV